MWKIWLSASKYDKSELLNPLAVNYSSLHNVKAHFDRVSNFNLSNSSQAHGTTCSRVWEHVLEEVGTAEAVKCHVK